MSLNGYFTKNKFMLVTNCIFPVDGAAALVTDGPFPPRGRHTLRTHHGMDDAAFNAALQMADEEGNLGVALTKDLVHVAGVALQRHITTLGPQVLPVPEMLHQPGGC